MDFLLGTGVTCSLFVILTIFNFCADLPIGFAGFLGLFSHIELSRESLYYALAIYMDLSDHYNTIERPSRNLR